MYAKVKTVYLTMQKPYVVQKVVEHVAEKAVDIDTVDAGSAANEPFQKGTSCVSLRRRPLVYSKTHMGMFNDPIYFSLRISISDYQPRCFKVLV